MNIDIDEFLDCYDRKKDEEICLGVLLPSGKQMIVLLPLEELEKESEEFEFGLNLVFGGHYR